MARHKAIGTQPRPRSVKLAARLLSGTFEHVVDHLLGHAIDLWRCGAGLPNESTGAPA